MNDALTRFEGRSIVHRLDPRVRLLAALVLSAAVSAASRIPSLGWALGVAILAAAAARLPPRLLAARLARLNGMMLFLWLVLPLSVPGRPLWPAEGLPFTGEGIRLAAVITLKGNAIVLLFSALAATVPPARLAAALHGIGVPGRLALLFALTVRYVDRIREEHTRLRRAMRARAFRPRFSAHTFRSFGYLLGLTLIRGLERSERTLAAMRCRGFDGRFRAVTEFRARPADAAFAALALALAATLAWMEWL